MTRQGDNSTDNEIMRVELPCRLEREAVTISLVFRPHPTRQYRLDLDVVVPGWLYEPGSHGFFLDIAKIELGLFLDDLQRLYDTRDVTISPSLLHLDVGESYVSFRACDLKAEEVFFMGLFRRGQYSEDNSVHPKLSGIPWYEEEKVIFNPWAWVAGFHGYVMKRDQIPGIIERLRNLAEDE